MNKETTEKIQQKIFKLLPARQRNRPGVLLADSCSEVSRLVAGWIKTDNKSSKITILKGNKVCGTKKSHDILAVETDSKTYIIDPTVWQFFPRKKLILMLSTQNIKAAINKVAEIYGGKWHKSEEITKISKVEEKKCLSIIKQNIKESLKQ